MKMGRVLLCVLGFLSVSMLPCGRAEDALLSIEPNWSTLFTGESVTFTCDPREGADTDWWYRMERNGHGFLSWRRDKNYTLQSPTAGDSAEYQCFFDHLRTHQRKTSNKVSLTVSDRDVILVSPASTLFEGESVTLRCRHRNQNKEKNVSFFRNGSLIEMDTKLQDTVEVTITSDWSSYSCSFEGKVSEAIKLKIEDKPKPVLTVSPSWLSPGAAVTLTCSVEHPSAGWRFFWYKAVPTLMNNHYRYELLPGNTTGTEQDSYIVHGQTLTAGYVCRAARGDPVYYTKYSKPRFVWSGDPHPESVKVSPDRAQHFPSESVSLRCDSAQWTVKRLLAGGHPSNCSSWGTVDGPTCRVNESHRPAVYWCESASGHFSNAVNISLQKSKGIILVSPVYPVTEGQSLTLSCKQEKKRALTSNVCFYGNGELIQNDSRAELHIPAVSRSHEGFYSCEQSGKPSAQSWMSVKPVNSHHSQTDHSLVFLLLLVGLLCGFLLVVLLLTMYCYQKSKRRHDESEDDCVYTRVKILSTARKPRPAVREETVYSEVRTGMALGP